MLLLLESDREFNALASDLEVSCVSVRRSILRTHSRTVENSVGVAVDLADEHVMKAVASTICRVNLDKRVVGALAANKLV